MNKRTFRDRVLAWFLAFLSLFTLLVLSGVLLVSRQNNNIDNVVQQINTIYNLYLEYHDSQNGLINFDLNEGSFYETGKSDYQAKAEEKKKEIDRYIFNLKQEKLYNKFMISKQIENLEKEINKHDSLFNELIFLQKNRGFKDWGLVGQMRDQVHLLEDYPFLNQENVLMLRRHEKDYIIRAEEAYIRKHEDRGALFREEIRSDPSISAIEKTEVLTILDLYLSHFKQLVEMDKRIGINSRTGGIWAQMEAKYQTLINELTALNSSMKARQSALYLNLKIMAFAIAVIFLLLSIFLSSYFAKWLTAPLHEFTQYITRMGKSSFKMEMQEPEIAYETEIHTLYREFNDMVHSLKEREKENIKANEALAYSEGKFKEMTDMLPIAVYETDDHGRFTYVNSAWRRQFGYTENQLRKGIYIDQIFSAEEQKDLLSLKQIRNRPVTGLRKNHSQFPALFFKNPRCIGQDLLGFRGIIIDNTEITQTMEELKAQKAKAEESDRLKTAFLTNMSHEIRTPMNSIIGFSHLLSHADLSRETMDEYIGHIVESGEVLLKLINDILDLAKIEAGEVNLNLEKCHFNKLLDEVHRSFSQSIPPEKNHLGFHLKKELEEDRIISTDTLRIRQILTNLISNAIKFTDDGFVEFGYRLPNEKQIDIYVRDTGRGIAREKVDVVFDRFRQVEDSLTREHGGTGLGLSITRNLVDLLGGRIQVETEVGKGTTFSVRLPIILEEEEPEEKVIMDLSEEASKWRSKNLLLVEDTKVNYLYIREVLKNTGINIIWVKNGKEAIEACRKNQELDIVLMDIQMPVLNGLDATKAIKAFRPGLPVIAQTAYAMAGEQSKCEEAGCDHYLPKPILPEDLITSIHCFFRHQKQDVEILNS